MVYIGSKRKYTKDICPIIQKYVNENNIKDFYDVFCGGANLIDNIYCENLYASDLSPSLIALHQQAQNDFSKIPKDGSREYWDNAYANWKKLRDTNFKDFSAISMPLYEIGAIEWYASFSNGGFPSGYAKNSDTRNYYQEAYRSHKKQSENENYQKINFNCINYLDIIIPENALIYCDSPYKSTKPYAINPKFNHEEYYNWLREKSKTNPIFISEQVMPDDFKSIWFKEVKRTAGKDNNFKACENLYFIDNRSQD